MYGATYNKTWLEIQSIDGQLSGTASDKAGVKSYGKSVFSANNTVTTIKVDLYPSGRIELFSANKGETLTQVAVWSPDIETADSGKLPQDAGFKDGYIGFAGMGSTSVDILNFKYEKDGEVLYQDDFISSKIGQEWRVSYNYTTPDYTRIGASGYLALGNDSSVCYTNPITINDLSDNLFEMNFKLKFKQIANGGAFEVALGMDNSTSDVATADAIGVEYNNSEYIFYYRKDGAKHYNYNYVWGQADFRSNDYYNV